MLLSDVTEYRRKRQSVSKSEYISTENMLQHYMGITQYTDFSNIEGIEYCVGDTLIGNIRPYLKKVWFATFNGACSADVLALKPNGINPEFLYDIIAQDGFIEYVMSGVKGSKMPRGDKSHILDYETALPSLAEQEKIAYFLRLLSSRMQKLQLLIESLKKYKRGLLQRILRHDNGWEEVSLSDVLFERKTYCEKDGTYEHATLSKEGVYGKTDRYDRDYLVMDEEKKYKITHLGDLCYNPANLKFGVICLNTYGDAIFSPIYITFEIAEEYNKEFIGLLLTRTDFINRALKYQQGTVYERMAVSPEDLLTMKIKVPSRETQNRIAHIFTELDARIRKSEAVLETLQIGKKQLLSSLFV